MAGIAARVAVAPDAYVPPPVTVPHVSLLELTLTVYSLVQEVTANNPMSARLKIKIFVFMVLLFKVDAYAAKVGICSEGKSICQVRWRFVYPFYKWLKI